MYIILTIKLLLIIIWTSKEMRHAGCINKIPTRANPSQIIYVRRAHEMKQLQGKKTRLILISFQKHED